MVESDARASQESVLSVRERVKVEVGDVIASRVRPCGRRLSPGSPSRPTGTVLSCDSQSQLQRHVHRKSVLLPRAAFCQLAHSRI